MNAYVSRERRRHVKLRQQGLTPNSGIQPGVARGREYDFVIPTEHRRENLDESIRDETAAYFEHHGITWHTMAHHMLSSQVCCLNHLMPLARDKAALRALFAPWFGDDLDFLPVPNECPQGRPWFVGFEYFGQRGDDFLGEGNGKPLTRGANCTSCDAVMLVRRQGLTEVILVEWKYTETYGNHGPRTGDDTRERRYRHLLEAADSPVLANNIPVSSYLVDPFYQFVRQQLLAHEMEKARHLGADVVRVLHIAPRANTAFHKINVPAFREFGATPVEAWKSLLRNNDRFISIQCENLFGALVDSGLVKRLAYARARYDFGSDGAATAPPPS